MTREEVLHHVMRGRLLIVGEFRGAHAENAGYVDQRTGQAIAYVRVIYLIECSARGILERSIIRQKRIGIEDPAQVDLPYEKGKHYVFFLEGFKLDRGVFTGWIGDRGPEPIEGIEEAAAAPEGAAPPLNLVY